MLARVNRKYVPMYWDDFFNDRFFNTLEPASRKENSPAVNVTEDEKGYTIELAAPGLSRKDIHLEIDDNVLTISSEFKEHKEEEEKNFLRREFNFRSFKRSFQLPETIDQEQIKATHEDGILSLTLPKREELVQKSPRQIEVN